jgi:hypothetical protein
MAAVGSDAPMRGDYSATNLELPERPGVDIRYYRHRVTPGYFEAVGIPIVAGRGFTPADDAGAARSAIVSRAFADKLWPGSEAVGRELRAGNLTMTVVGVAGNVRFRDLRTDLMDAAEDPDLYVPYDQAPTTTVELVVRGRSPGAVSAEALRRAAQSLDRDIALANVQRLDAVLDLQTATARFGSQLLALFGLAALVLAAIGLYGETAFLVAARRREIAIRIAIGAAPRSVLAAVLRRGMAIAGAGVAVGVAAALLGARFIASLLYGVSPSDPVSIAAVVLLLAVVAALANAIPAFRAARTDPQLVLMGD